MTNLDRNSSTGSSVRLGRWAVGMALPFRAPRFLTVATSAGGCLPAGAVARRCCGGPAGGLLRVELDDELFLDLGVDLRPDRECMNEDTHLVRDHLNPRGRGALAGLGASHYEGGHLV